MMFQPNFKHREESWQYTVAQRKVFLTGTSSCLEIWWNNVDHQFLILRNYRSSQSKQKLKRKLRNKIITFYANKYPVSKPQSRLRFPSLELDELLFLQEHATYLIINRKKNGSYMYVTLHTTYTGESLSCKQGNCSFQIFFDFCSECLHQATAHTGE